MYDELKYIDETDKSLGIAGMSIALMVCDGENTISAVSLNDGEDTITFTPEANFSLNPAFSAKYAWNQLLGELQLFSAMLWANIMCRHILASRQIRQEIINTIHDLIFQHGADLCSLDNDELEALFNKDMRYYHRLFNHPTVAQCADNLATTLRAQRRMSAAEVFERLSRLSF